MPFASSACYSVGRFGIILYQLYWIAWPSLDSCWGDPWLYWRYLHLSNPSLTNFSEGKRPRLVQCQIWVPKIKLSTVNLLTIKIWKNRKVSKFKVSQFNDHSYLFLVLFRSTFGILSLYFSNNFTGLRTLGLMSGSLVSSDPKSGILLFRFILGISILRLFSFTGFLIFLGLMSLSKPILRSFWIVMFSNLGFWILRRYEELLFGWLLALRRSK